MLAGAKIIGAGLATIGLAGIIAPGINSCIYGKDIITIST